MLYLSGKTILKESLTRKTTEVHIRHMITFQLCDFAPQKCGQEYIAQIFELHAQRAGMQFVTCQSLSEPGPGSGGIPNGASGLVWETLVSIYGYVSI